MTSSSGGQITKVRGRGFEPPNPYGTEFLPRRSLKSCAFGQLGYPRAFLTIIRIDFKTSHHRGSGGRVILLTEDTEMSVPF